MPEGEDLPPPEPIEGKKEGDNEHDKKEPSQEETDSDTDLEELYNLIDERDRELSTLRSELDSAIARIAECESAIGTFRTHNHDEPSGPEERHPWFRRIGR